jgi:D-beta-D-heptose 7-phosphate kinase/D-beta-D-heptose 1-phosphate adenosyltransferase
MHADLLDIVDRFPGKRVVLVGDFMLDRYVFGDAERISPEAPVPVLRVVERQDRVGGAGAVAQMIATLGATVQCFGLLGRDAFGDRVVEQLSHAGADTSGLLRVDDRPTITKTRLVGLAEHRHRQQILRVDDEVVAPPASEDRQRLIESATAALPEADVVCLEDYGKGVLAYETCRALIAAARAAGVPVLIDPARGPDWPKYRGATLMTPNRAELEHGAGQALAENEIEQASTQIVADLELNALAVTLGRDGALLVRRDKAPQRFPTQPRAVYDNTGAGDAVLAIMAVAIASGATFEQAVSLANIAGGIEVSKFGVVPIARDEVIAELQSGHDQRRGKLRSVDELLQELQVRRQRGETVVFTNGCFDLLHPGHVELLDRARALGSLLVIGLNSDKSVRAQGKGDDRPIRRQHDRVRMLTALEAVDYVVLFDDVSVLGLIEQIKPDVLAKGGDYQMDEVVGASCVTASGGRVELIPFIEGHGTTDELRRIRGMKV